MRTYVLAATLGMWMIALIVPSLATAQPRATEATVVTETPQSLKVEHEAIHSALIEATKAPGRVGLAAKELADVLHPHFVREEQIALPPLGLLAPLSAGAAIPEAELSKALTMTDALRAELPRMLEEHQAIRSAVGKLRNEAQTAKATKYVQLADELALHAQTEEEVLYPAALLVGELIRLRGKSR